MNIKTTRWLNDSTKAKRLRDLVLDPLFVEATDVVLDQASYGYKRGENAIHDNALELAYQSGLRDAFRKLELLTEFTQDHLDEQKKKNDGRLMPWQHIEQERSTFV
jgi:hypothetical protein